MLDFQYDLFVIGAGSGGVRAARMSAAMGAKVAIAEDLYLGGTCVNVGCVPKKLFVYASQYSELIDHASGFGWSIGKTEFNWQQLVQNKNTEIERLNGIYQRILDKSGAELIRGRASFVDQHTVEVNQQQYTAKNILIATGGWPHIPEIEGKEFIITSNEVFYLDELPKSITIVGGGYIAVEFAGIFNGLGVDTTLVYRGPLFLRGFDDDIRQHLAKEMQNKGIKLLFDTNITRIEQSNEQYKCELSQGKPIETDLVMYATGRKPNIKNLGLENVNVKINNNNAIVVNDHFQTSVDHIYAIGDVIDRVQLTPVALAEGMYLSNYLFGDINSAVNYDNIPTAVFSQPNIGTVGLTENEARERFDQIEIFKSIFTPMKLSLSEDTEKTFMKLIVDKSTDKVIGAHMVGPDAGEIIQGIGIAIKTGATKSDFDKTIGIHPTTAEEFVTMREPSK